jgi:hypothetical protein
VHADELIPFIRDHADDATIPPEIRDQYRVTVA